MLNSSTVRIKNISLKLKDSSTEIKKQLLLSLIDRSIDNIDEQLEYIISYILDFDLVVDSNLIESAVFENAEPFDIPENNVEALKENLYDFLDNDSYIECLDVDGKSYRICLREGNWVKTYPLIIW